LLRDRTLNLQYVNPVPCPLCYVAPSYLPTFVSTLYTIFFLYRRPREEETKAKPNPNPNSNPTIACELLAPVLKYKTGGTTGRLFLKYKTRGTTGRLFLKYKTRGNYWSPVPKVQDPGKSISERNLVNCWNNSHGKIFLAAGTIATS